MDPEGLQGPRPPTHSLRGPQVEGAQETSVQQPSPGLEGRPRGGLKTRLI